MIYIYRALLALGLFHISLNYCDQVTKSKKHRALMIIKQKVSSHTNPNPDLKYHPRTAKDLLEHNQSQELLCYRSVGNYNQPGISIKLRQPRQMPTC